MHEELWVEGPAGRLAVSISGLEPASNARPLARPIVFIHGDLGTLNQWDEVRAALEGEHPTVAFDRRGHGRSELPRDGLFTQAAGAADILAVVDHLKVAAFVLVGHSGGALVSWTCAVREPERVAGLMLVDPPPDPAVMPKELIEQTLAAMRGPDYRRAAESYYRSIAGNNPAVVERVVAEARATSQQTLIGTFEALRDFEPRALAGRYPGPMRCVIQPQFDVEGALHRIQPGFRQIAIPGTGHWIQLDAPEPLLDCLRRFLRAPAART